MTKPKEFNFDLDFGSYCRELELYNRKLIIENINLVKKLIKRKLRMKKIEPILNEEDTNIKK